MLRRRLHSHRAPPHTAETLAQILESKGIKPTPEALRRAWDAADRWFREEYHRLDDDTWVSGERILAAWRRHYSMMLRELSIDDVESHVANAVIWACAKHENWQAYPDALAALSSVSSAGFTIGIVSDWGSRLPNILEVLGISPYVDFILATAGAARPAPGFFRLAWPPCSLIARAAPSSRMLPASAHCLSDPG